MTAKDRRLFEVGELLKQQAERQGFSCHVIRHWNNEYEISFYKGGNFDTVHQDVKTLLNSAGFSYTTQVASKQVKIGYPFECLYANFSENIGCFIEKDRHHILLFSNLRETYMAPCKS